jgi:uncharacterized membrane protein YdfJ with MMPL/SSD domain
MLGWFGKAVYSARWFVLLGVVLAVAAAGWYGIDAISVLDSNIGHSAQGGAAQAQAILDSRLSASRVDIVVLFENDQLSVHDPLFRVAMNDALEPLWLNPDVASIATYYSTGSPDFISRNGHATFAAIRLQDQNDPHDVYGLMQREVHSSLLRVSFGGSIPADAQFAAQSKADLQQMEYISFPIVALALVLVFDGLIAAGLPLLIGGVAIVGALAGLRGLTNFLDISVFAVNIVSVLGLGLAIDYSLFMIMRFREELLVSDNDVRAALARTMQTAGRTVLFSGLTVSTCLIALTFFPLLTLRSIGFGAIAAVLVAMLAALTILPALLAVLGRRINALSVRRLFARRTGMSAPRSRNVRGDGEGPWLRLSQFVMRFPVPVIVVTLALLISLGLPFLHVNFAAPDVRALPKTQSARYVADRLLNDFPHSNGAQHDVVVLTRGDALSDANLVALNGLVRQIQALPDVTSVTSVVSLAPNLTLAQYEYLYAHPQRDPQLVAAARALASGDATHIMVTVAGADNSAAAQTVVRDLRALTPPAGFTLYVGGTTASQMDLFAALQSHLLPAGLMILFATIVLLFLMTGSIVVPLKAVVLNFLSLTATLGAIVFVFQEGHGQQILSFTPIGSIDPSQMMILFTIAFGLSMDYEVFLLSRIKEQYDLTGDNRLAVATGLQRTGRLITSAALLLAIVLFATITSQIIFVKELGLGLALAVIMDATVVRALLVPATMRLLGRWNWWPRARTFGERDTPASHAEPPPAPAAEDPAERDAVPLGR